MDKEQLKSLLEKAIDEEEVNEGDDILAGVVKDSVPVSICVASAIKAMLDGAEVRKMPEVVFHALVAHTRAVFHHGIKLGLAVAKLDAENHLDSTIH